MSDLKSRLKLNAFRYLEKIRTEIYENSQLGSLEIAKIIVEEMKKKNQQGKTFVLGLATGSSPKKVYKELIRMHKEEGVSFNNVKTFNLDEYYPMSKERIQSYHRFMHEQLFNHIDIPSENINIPAGNLSMNEIEEFCSNYEIKIEQSGGIDLQILGIGRTGHIGFNEPGSSLKSTTRLIWLDPVTMQDAASDFYGYENVPKKAITMGIQTIMNARKILIMAWGEAKSKIVKKAVEGEMNSEIPSSFLQQHQDVQFFLDEQAAEKLTRINHPWMIKGVHKFEPINYNDIHIKKKAVIWLAKKTKKPISSLLKTDYEHNGLYDLVEQYKDIRQLNQEVTEQIISTLKMEVLDKQNQTILVFAPHPDTDSICMGGTIKKLCDLEHDVHIAYQTSGGMGVFDYEVQRFSHFGTLFCQHFGLEESIGQCQELQNGLAKELVNKLPEDIDSEISFKLKSLIRQCEALQAAQTYGVPSSKVYFLDLPFYTGSPNKNPVGKEDIKKTEEILLKIKPNYVFAAGDLGDPHGTNRLALQAFISAIDSLNNSTDQSISKWIKNMDIYLYRGAWQEWEMEKISLAVPLGVDDMAAKKQAIFKHQTQKDKARFPGSDQREFWMRAEERNKQTAKLFDQLGLYEYEGIEVFCHLNHLKNFIKF